MSASKSDLSGKKYGYDMVVAVTQASVNATMEEWLDKVDEAPFVMGYQYDPEKKNFKQIGNWDEFVSELGFDPFTLPNNTPESDPKMKALTAKYFAFGFQAQIGLPDLPLDKIPPIISFDQAGSYVTYNMVNKEFQVIGIESPPYGEKYWLNTKQSEGDEVWDFQFSVDLDLREDDINNHFHNLPPDTQKEIKNLGEDMFSVQQLFVDLNTAALTKSYTIKGLKPTNPAYTMLTSVFFKQYFKKLNKDGGVMLGYSVNSKKPFPDNVSLIPTDLNFEICAYQKDGKPTTDYSAYTLNYLVMSDGHSMPAPVPFEWNWVDKENISKEAGVMAINRNSFRDFLAMKMAPLLQNLAKKVSCTCHVNCLKIEISTGFSTDSAAQSFKKSGSGSQLLSYSYSSSDHPDDSQYCGVWANWGNWGVSYTSSCDVSVSGNKITVKANVNAHCHLNADGGVTEGNWASYEITTDYTVGVSVDGKLVVTQNDPKIVDNSQKPDPGWWSEFISLGTIDHCVDQIQGFLKPLLKGFGTGFESSIADMLNGSNGWTFPGGQTYAFQSVLFSDEQDLVADLLYKTPKIDKH